MPWEMSRLRPLGHSTVLLLRNTFLLEPSIQARSILPRLLSFGSSSQSVQYIHLKRQKDTAVGTTGESEDIFSSWSGGPLAKGKKITLYGLAYAFLHFLWTFYELRLQTAWHVSLSVISYVVRKPCVFLNNNNDSNNYITIISVHLNREPRRFKTSANF